MNKFDINNFVIDKVVSFRFCRKCPSCNEEYELIRDEYNVLTDPHFCHYCNYDFHKHKYAKALEKLKETECQLRYDLISADNCGIRLHPQEQMKHLGYKLIDSIPQSISDCWWFTVDKLIEPLPEYLQKMKYTIGES